MSVITIVEIGKDLMIIRKALDISSIICYNMGMVKRTGSIEVLGTEEKQMEKTTGDVRMTEAEAQTEVLVKEYRDLRCKGCINDDKMLDGKIYRGHCCGCTTWETIKAEEVMWAEKKKWEDEKAEAKECRRSIRKTNAIAKRKKEKNMVKAEFIANGLGRFNMDKLKADVNAFLELHPAPKQNEWVSIKIVYDITTI